MAQFPSLPIWTDAYLADTAHLTNEEHGIYLRLLMYAWRSPNCNLPNCDKRLAIMVGLTPKKWLSIKPTIMQFWTEKADHLENKRLTSEREKVKRFREQRSYAGKASAKAKLLKNNNSMTTSVTTKDQRDGARTDQRGGKNLSLSIKEEKDINKLICKKNENSRNNLRHGEQELLDVLKPEIARAVVDHRIKIKKPLTPHAASLLAKQFSRCPFPNDAADAMIVNGWQGFDPSWLEGKTPTGNRGNITPMTKLDRDRDSAIWLECEKILNRKAPTANNDWSFKTEIVNQARRNLGKL